MNRTLVIGFGNVFRRDDGAGFAVLNAVRERLGRPLLGTDDDGFDDLRPPDGHHPLAPTGARTGRGRRAL